MNWQKVFQNVCVSCIIGLVTLLVNIQREANNEQREANKQLAAAIERIASNERGITTATERLTRVEDKVNQNCVDIAGLKEVIRNVK